MKSIRERLKKSIYNLIIASSVMGIFIHMTCNVYAEEYEEEIIWDDVYYGEDSMEEFEDWSPNLNFSAESGMISKSAALPMKGSYSVPEGWKQDFEMSASEKDCYVFSLENGQRSKSTISCTYIDTAYSVLEYEQLREMLMNNLLYSDSAAQITSSAGYTDAKDYLYILIADNSSAEYRDLYYYVVGDYRCFCVTLREYRDEACAFEGATAISPEQSATKLANSFVWYS